MTMISEIRLIEQLAMRAWPAEVAEELDGWTLRWHKFFSRRVNSVWPNAWGGYIPLANKLEKVENFYTMRGQPAQYQICPAALPSGLDESLAARGYTVDALTAVQVAHVEEVIKLAGSGGRQVDIQIFETLVDEWIEGYCLVQDGNLNSVPNRRAVLERISLPSVYGLVRVAGEAAAVGRGVLDQGWLGIFGMVTGADFHRRGYATKILGALSQWAAAQRAKKMYLQVMENNPGAKALYEKVGFKTLYHYHFRVQTPRLSASYPT